jgi:hypothetical protein
MCIELNGRDDVVKMEEPIWSAVEEIAREFGWTPKYDKPPRTRGWARTWLLTEDSAWALAKALHRAIDAKEAEIGHLRAVADLAFWGAIHAEEGVEEEEE